MADVAALVERLTELHRVLRLTDCSVDEEACLEGAAALTRLRALLKSASHHVKTEGDDSLLYAIDAALEPGERNERHNQGN